MNNGLFGLPQSPMQLPQGHPPMGMPPQSHLQQQPVQLPQGQPMGMPPMLPPQGQMLQQQQPMGQHQTEEKSYIGDPVIDKYIRMFIE